MLLSFFIAVLIFMLPFIIISLFLIFGKHRRNREAWKALFKENMPKYHLFFLLHCGLTGWLVVWMLVVAIHHYLMYTAESYFTVKGYFTGARRRADRLYNRANDIFDAISSPFGIDTL